MYLRVTERRHRDGSSVASYALAENVWNAQAKRSEAQVIHNFGRADQLDKAALQRLVASIQRIINAEAAGAITSSGHSNGFAAGTFASLATRDKAGLPDIEIDAVFAFGVVLAARTLWETLASARRYAAALPKAS
jgi:hypothetical protein